MLVQLDRLVSYYLSNTVWQDNTIAEIYNQRNYGTHIKIYDNTLIITHYKDGYRHGLYQQFRSGVLVEWCNYIIGIPDGHTMLLDLLGNKCEGVYVNGYLHGEVKMYDYHNELIEIKNYKNGVVTGPVILYHNNGAIKYKFNYEKDKKHGLCYTYNSTGRLLETAYYEYNAKHGEETVFYKNGAIKHTTEYKHGTWHGYRRYYRKDGTLSLESTYASDRMNGPQTDYRRDGSIKSIIHYKNDQETGEWYTYYSNGNIKACSKLYIDDGIEFIKYYENGAIKCIRTLDYKTYYNIDGTIRCKGRMCKTERVGIWLFYDHGRVSEKTYVNGSVWIC